MKKKGLKRKTIRSRKKEEKKKKEKEYQKEIGENPQYPVSPENATTVTITATNI